ncbi:MAG: DUF1343 domain-containing protein [Bacteroidales bacterium]|nr:DUF1343 domain-containing protein [Bacteroidales bacterium]
MRFLFILLVLVPNFVPAFSQGSSGGIRVGAERTELFLPLLHRKNVAVVANHTSLVGSRHLVDTLLQLKVKVKKIFCPEHGFRGNVEAGELIKNHIDTRTGIPIVSLYASNKKPKPESLKGVDVVILDLQDVGVRFYTYISTMHYVMEACAECKIPLIVLDRPNPNGFYVDGPVLDLACQSFVGLHPVPLVHGMTIGEFAQMINGEGWLAHRAKCNVTVIPCSGYTHSTMYRLPVKPSPNLPNQLSVLLYPSLGFFEGANVSVGRGTDFPFQVFGYPDYSPQLFGFTPEERVGASIDPPFKGKMCYGVDLRDFSEDYLVAQKAINLEWLIYTYKTHPHKDRFFNSFFQNLAGTSQLQKQIENGLDALAIRESWQLGIANYKRIRKGYLLYPDFE